MKIIFNGILTVIFFVMIISCSHSKNTGATNDNLVIEGTEKDDKLNNIPDTGSIYVYYFHGSVRCHTCISVDEDTHKYLQELYPEKFKNGKMVFGSFNADKDERIDLIKKYKIWGQTLLFIKGDKVVDMTEEAFMYVTTNPEKWKSIVKEKMDKLIEL